MKAQQIPLYAADGRSLGYRTPEAARRLIAQGYVEPVLGRKGHLKALQLKQPDGCSSIASMPPQGSKYSFREHFDTGTVAWALKRLGKGNELQPIFLQVVTDCLAEAK